MMGNRSVVLSFENKADAERALGSIDDLEVSVKPLFQENKGLAYIYPLRLEKDYEYNSLPARLTADLENYQAEVLKIPDFKGSKDFYSRLSARSSKVKILEDKFSEDRGEILFKYISQTEKGLRKRYHDFYDVEELAKSRDYINRRPDHFINYYGLSEMINDQLLAPSSNQFYIDKLSTASNVQEKLAARTFTRLDELDLPIDAEDLRQFAKIRNAVMHFRVVTYEEAEFLLRVSAFYQVKELERTLRDIDFNKADERED